MLLIILNLQCKKSFSLCFIPGTLKFGRPELYRENPLVILSVTVSISVPLYLKRTVIKTLKDRCENCMVMLLRRFSNCSTPVKC